MLEHCSLVEGSFLNVSSYHKLGNFQFKGAGTLRPRMVAREN